MDQNEQIVNLLQDIHRTQLAEARLAKARWRTAMVLLICGSIVAAPAVVSYVHQVLVLWF
jgi:hypothetical protein